jgi:hypothetical protein
MDKQSWGADLEIPERREADGRLYNKRPAHPLLSQQFKVFWKGFGKTFLQKGFPEKKYIILGGTHKWQRIFFTGLTPATL